MNTLHPLWVVTARLARRREAPLEIFEVHALRAHSARAEARRQRPGYVVLDVARKEDRS